MHFLFKGVDYESLSEFFVLAAGDFPRQCVNLTVLDDEIDEGNEELLVNIANNNNWPELIVSAVVTILENGGVCI